MDIQSEINVTLLIDVCLVLLIIFMVVTPMLAARGKPVILPETSNPAKIEQKKDQVFISITAEPDNPYYIEEKPVSWEMMVNDLRELRARRPEAEFVILGDRRLPYGNIRKVMDHLADLGFQTADLSTNSAKKNSAGPL